MRRVPYLMRYATRDDFGVPTVSFRVCTLWYISAHAAVGRRKEARALFENMLARRNGAGLLE